MHIINPFISGACRCRSSCLVDRFAQCVAYYAVVSCSFMHPLSLTCIHLPCSCCPCMMPALASTLPFMTMISRAATGPQLTADVQTFLRALMAVLLVALVLAAIISVATSSAVSAAAATWKWSHSLVCYLRYILLSPDSSTCFMSPLEPTGWWAYILGHIYMFVHDTEHVSKARGSTFGPLTYNFEVNACCGTCF